MSFKVLFFNRSFYPDITATGQLLTELCEDLVEVYGCQVTVIAGRPLFTSDPSLSHNGGYGIIRQEGLNGVKILRVKSTTFNPRHFSGRIANYLSYFFLSFIATLRLNKQDLVVTLTDPPVIGLIGLWVARRFNIPFIISVRDIFPEAARGLEESQNKLINFFLGYMVSFYLKKATGIVALGEAMRKCLIEKKGTSQDKITIIHDWADTRQIVPVAKDNPFSLTNGLSGYFIVMYAGNIGVSSGLEFVLESARLLKDHKNILLVFIGEGITKHRLVALTKGYKLENVRFFPYQPKEMLSQVFSSADVFIIPLKKGLTGYSVPSKIYPIMASGRPYIACVEEESEITIITEKFGCGLLAGPQDYQELTDKILICYNNRELCLRMGENARKASASFDRAVGVRKYYEIFNQLSGSKKTV